MPYTKLSKIFQIQITHDNLYAIIHFDNRTRALVAGLNPSNHDVTREVRIFSNPEFSHLMVVLNADYNKSKI